MYPRHDLTTPLEFSVIYAAGLRNALASAFYSHIYRVELSLCGKLRAERKRTKVIASKRRERERDDAPLPRELWFLLSPSLSMRRLIAREFTARVIRSSRVVDDAESGVNIWLTLGCGDWKSVCFPNESACVLVSILNLTERVCSLRQ